MELKRPAVIRFLGWLQNPHLVLYPMVVVPSIMLISPLTPYLLNYLSLYSLIMLAAALIPITAMLLKIFISFGSKKDGFIEIKGNRYVSQVKIDVMHGVVLPKVVFLTHGKAIRWIVIGIIAFALELAEDVRGMPGFFFGAFVKAVWLIGDCIRRLMKNVAKLVIVITWTVMEFVARLISDIWLVFYTKEPNPVKFYKPLIRRRVLLKQSLHEKKGRDQ